MKNITTLTVGFWFGFNLPVEDNDSFFTIVLDGNNLLSDYAKLKRQYEEFKEKNSNNPVPYKDCLEDEECFIFFPEPVGTKLTTFLEVYNMSLFLYTQQININNKIKELEDEIENLEKIKHLF